MNALMTHSQMMIHSLPTLLLGFLIKSTFLLLTAWAAGCLLRRASAATRHLVWSVALGGVLLVPLLSLSLPQWKVAWGHVSASAPPAPMPVPQALPLPIAPTVSEAAPPSAPVSNESDTPPAVTAVSRAVPAPTSRRQFSTFTRLLGIGLFVWLIGLSSVLGQLLVGLSRLARIESRSLPLEHGDLQIAEDVHGKIGMRRPVRFLRATEASTIAVPVTWRVFRPVVLLPAQASAWSEDCLRAALLHELAHVQRMDWPTQLMGRLACALYWWHPLVWLAARQAREESERACDDLVLGMGMKAADYAQRLVEVVRSMPEGAPSRTVAIAMAQPSEVEGRVRAVLAKGRNRMPVHRNVLVAGFVTGIVTLLPLSALHIAAQAQQADDASVLTVDVVPTGALVTRNTRWVLSAEYLRDVACPRFPDRPITVVVTTDTAGVKHSVFHDKRTGRVFRDSSQIEVDLDHLLAEGTQPRLGAAVYSMPIALASMKHMNGQTVSLTPEQRAKADLLGSEGQGWAGRDSALIISDGDVEPSASAAQGDGGARVTLRLLPEGQKKLSDFQQAHVGEYMGITVAASPLPRIVALIGPANGGGLTLDGLTDAEAQSLVQAINTPDGTEVVGGGIRRASYPDGTVYEADEDMNRPVPEAKGYTSRLPNGCTVGVEAVSQLVNKGGKWVTGGSRWTPEGSPLPAIAIGESSQFAPTVSSTNGLAPHEAKLHITVPSHSAVTKPVSTYLQLEGTASVPWAHTFERWGDRVGYFYPQGGEPCTLRVGIAAGPWRTTARLPFHLSQQELPRASSDSPWPLELKLDDRPALMYKDKQNHSHTEYFLPAGQRLGNVARRLVAVDTSGRTVASSDFNSIPRAVPTISPPSGIASDTYPVGVGIFGICFYGPLLSDVSSIKEYRLETRPYQVVEFRDIQLQPRVPFAPSGQTLPLSGEQAEKGRRSWIAPPNEAMARPLTFENRIGGRLLSTLQAQNGYDPLTATLRQVTMTNYRKDGSVRSLIECKQAQWRGGVLAMHEATVRSFGDNSAQTVTVRGRLLTLNPENSTLVVAGGGVANLVSVGQWDAKEQRSLSNLKRIDLTIQEYIQDNDKRLPPLRTLPALENALMPYLKQQEKFPDPATGQPFRVRGRDLFVSPLTGQPYLLAAALSGRPISQVANPASTILLRDTLRTPSGAIQCVLEAFADGHVGGRLYDSKGVGRAIQ